MPRFIFFTKTVWTEAPRIRHQLSRMLSSAGHEVHFFQKPLHFWNRTRVGPRVVENNIFLYQYTELIHHKLRFTDSLTKANGFWVMKQIRNNIVDLAVDEDVVIVNFNYDYVFLRDLFPKIKIITIMNDDFLARLFFNYQVPFRRSLESTCNISDTVLAVSFPLLRQLETFCKPQLFLPWSDCDYKAPASAACRDTLLLWGYINDRLDFDFLHEWACMLAFHQPDVKLLFVGPQEISQSVIKALSALPNIAFRSPSNLDDLPLDRIIAGIIPYISNSPRINAITFSNKAFQMLGRGLPLIIRGMPNFYDAPFILRGDEADAVELVNTVRSEFYKLQPLIRQFVSENTSAVRLTQFLSYV